MNTIRPVFSAYSPPRFGVTFRSASDSGRTFEQAMKELEALLAEADDERPAHERIDLIIELIEQAAKNVHTMPQALSLTNAVSKRRDQDARLLGRTPDLCQANTFQGILDAYSLRGLFDANRSLSETLASKKAQRTQTLRDSYGTGTEIINKLRGKTTG